MSNELKILANEDPADFSRGYATRDNDGTARAANEPRRAKAKIAAGQTGSTQLTTTTGGDIDEWLASGWNIDGTKRTTVRLNHEGPTLDIFIGDEVALYDSGAPTTSGGYGWKELANGDRWFRYEGVVGGENSGSTAHPVLAQGPIRNVLDFGNVVPKLRKGNEAGQDSLVLQPSYGSCYYGLICLGCVAQRYISGSYPSAVFSSDGLLTVFWQEPLDADLDTPANHFAIGRDEGNMQFFTDAHGTGRNVRHDVQPGRPRYKVWACSYPSLPGKTTTTRQDDVFFATDDYMFNGVDVGPTGSVESTGHGGVRIGNHVALVNERWDTDNISTIDFTDDRTSDPDDQGWHNHASLMGSVMDNGTRKLYLLSVVADDFRYQGLVARVLDSPYDPDNIDSTFLTDFADSTKWSTFNNDANNDTIIYLLGNHPDESVTAQGQRLMRPIPGNTDGKTLLFSDDKSSRVREIEWMDTSEAPKLRTVAGPAMTQRSYAFWAVQRSPGINGGEMLAMTHVPGLEGWLIDAPRGYTLWYSPDGESWGSVETPVADIANAQSESWHFGTGGRVLISSSEGLRTVDLPATKTITPIPLARGIKNILASDASQIQDFGGDNTVTLLSRSAGEEFVDGSLNLPRDPGESTLGIKWNRGPDGKGSVLFNPFADGVNTSSYDSTQLDPVDQQLTFVYNMLLATDGPIGVPYSVLLTHRDTNSTNTLNNSQLPANSARMSVGTPTRGVFPQDTEQWTRRAVSYTHGISTQDPSNLILRTQFDEFVGGDGLSTAYIVHEQCYQGRGWPGAPLPPSPPPPAAPTDETANPETITLGWDFADGDTIFGVCFVSESLDPKTMPMFAASEETGTASTTAPDSQSPSGIYTLKQVEAEAVIAEIGDPATNNYLSLSIVWDSFHDSGSFNAPQIRIRGKVGGTEITPSDTRWIDANGVKPRLGPGDVIAFRVTQDASSGPSVSCLADGIRVTTPDVSGLAGQPTMQVSQVGADIDNKEHAMELEWGLFQRASASEYVGDEQAFARLSALEFGGGGGGNGAGNLTVSGIFRLTFKPSVYSRT